ncbi:MAG: lipoyl(octanoyl) transferase LipB [Gammaproteobacteria bacterium]
MPCDVVIRSLGQVPYVSTWEKMRTFTEQRTSETCDEIWCLSHPPVFTQGQAGKPEHLINPGDIEVVQTDRGGQVTYHGPGQLVIYFLIDLKRRNQGIRALVDTIEQGVIAMLKADHIAAHTIEKAPGVYVDQAKVCSLGLRVKRGCTYHGLALNVNMDLTPFSRINPCGYKDLNVCQTSDLGGAQTLEQARDRLIAQLLPLFGYNHPQSSIEGTL